MVVGGAAVLSDCDNGPQKGVVRFRDRLFLRVKSDLSGLVGMVKVASPVI